jgi:hypothetical protein
MNKKLFAVLYAIVSAAILGIIFANYNVGAHQPQVHGVHSVFTHKEGNQFLALFLDWLIWLLALCLCLFSNILRDSVGDSSKLLGQNYAGKALALASGKTPPDPAQPPYSLAKTQLVIWITIIASVYTYAILWDGRNIDSINQTALILMGISAGTFAAAAVLDTSEIQQGIPRIQDQPSSKDFFMDILSDSQGISIHRFQNFVWTLVAIFIYFYRYANPPAGHADSLPVLDSTLLALTGISSATYLTLKARENPAPPNSIAPLKIILDASASEVLTAAQRAAVAVSGFPDAVVAITDQAGNKTNALPDLTNRGFGFLATNITPGPYTIDVTWTGQPVPSTPPTPVTLTAHWTGQISNTSNTSNPLTIKFS